MSSFSHLAACLRQFALALLFSAAAVAVPAAARAADTSDLWIFGDSLSDTGNVFALTGVLSQQRPDLVPAPFPVPPYALGRFSNGPLWVETLAEGLGVPDVDEPAGLTLGPLFANTFVPAAGGHNFAIGGARTGFGGAFDPFGIPTGMLVQVDLYLAEHQQQADPDALYVLLAGSNDVRDAAAPGGQPIVRRDVRLLLAAEAYRNAIQRLAAAGARHFLVGNAPDAGLTPESRYRLGNSAAATRATRVFNRVLAKVFAQVDHEPGISLQRLDLFGLVEAIVGDATGNGGRLFGITNVDTPCLDVSSLFPEVVIPGAGTVPCARSLFADDLHPTAAVHRIVGEVALACRQARRSEAGEPAADARLARFCASERGPARDAD